LNGLPKFIASWPDLLGLTDATSNVTEFPIAAGWTPVVWFCGDRDSFIAAIVTDLPLQMVIHVKATQTAVALAGMPSPPNYETAS
jgi:hypothetical protein